MPCFQPRLSFKETDYRTVKYPGFTEDDEEYLMGSSVLLNHSPPSVNLMACVQHSHDGNPFRLISIHRTCSWGCFSDRRQSAVYGCYQWFNHIGIYFTVSNLDSARWRASPPMSQTLSSLLLKGYYVGYIIKKCSSCLSLKEHSGQGDQTAITVSPGFTNTSIM